MPNSPDKLNSALARACVTLGLTPPFSAEQLKTRYRELAKIYHPDVGTNRNNDRFAKISQAYELATEHIGQIAQHEITLVTDLNRSSSQVADILEQLRQARTENLQASQKLKNLEAETAALHAHLNQSRTFTLKRIIGVSLLIITGITLGFLAGMLWSSPPAIINLTPIPAQQITTEPTASSFTAHLPDLGYDAHIHLSGPAVAKLTYDSGTISLGSAGATLNSTPTIVIEKFPDISVSPVPHTDQQPAATPPATPAASTSPGLNQQQMMAPGTIPTAIMPVPGSTPDSVTSAPVATRQTTSPQGP